LARPGTQEEARRLHCYGNDKSTSFPAAIIGDAAFFV
jgi:hypothetical protein